MSAVGFVFLEAGAADEVFIGDFAACRYLVFLNGVKSAGACYALIGRVISSNALEEEAK